MIEGAAFSGVVGTSAERSWEGRIRRFWRFVWRIIKALWRHLRVAALVFVVVLLPFLRWFYQILHSPRPSQYFVDFFAIYLASVGIVYAIYHGVELTHQTDTLRKQLCELGVIEQSMSTQRVGRFPQYLKEIAPLFRGSNKLMILVDGADHGSFFAPEDHARLHWAMCEFLATGGEVQILVAGPPAAWTAVAPPSLAEYWDNYIRSVSNDRGFQRWLEKAAAGSPEGTERRKLFSGWLKETREEKLSGLSLENLEELLLQAKSIRCESGQLKEDGNASANVSCRVLVQARQYLFEKRLADAGASIEHDPDHPTSLFLWISSKTKEPVEDAIALFAVPNPQLSERETAIAFRTIDPGLIRTFEGIFKKRWEDRCALETPGTTQVGSTRSQSHLEGAADTGTLA